MIGAPGWRMARARAFAFTAFLAAVLSSHVPWAGCFLSLPVAWRVHLIGPGLAPPSHGNWAPRRAKACRRTNRARLSCGAGAAGTCTGERKRLRTLLGDANEDGTRRTVLLLGAGLHYQLRALTESTELVEKWDKFTNWNGLLASIVDGFGLPRVAHEDPAATWEGVVTRISGNSGDEAGEEQLQAHKAERLALQALAGELRTIPADGRALRWLGELLTRFRDVVCLNFDPSLELAALEVGAEVAREAGKKSRVRDTLRCTFSWTREGRFGRVWSPHGESGNPRGIVLGTTSYGRALSSLTEEWANAKAASKKYPPDGANYWLDRRAPEPFEPVSAAGQAYRLSWVDLFLASDLVMLGTSLDRAEVDLWWALHQRARNVVRMSSEERPHTLLLCAGPPSQHLATGPADIETVSFDCWSEAWEFIASD